MQLSGGNIFVSIAPYTFPFVTFLSMAITTILHDDWESVGRAMTNLSFGFFLFSVIDASISQQPDIKAYGKAVSLLLVFENLFVIYTLLVLFYIDKMDALGAVWQF